VGSDDALAPCSSDRGHRDGLHAPLVVSVVDLDLDSLAAGNHDLDVPDGPEYLPPAAQDTGYAFLGRQQGDASAGTCSGRRELCADRKNKTTLNAPGGLWWICSHHLVDDVQTILSKTPSITSFNYSPG
jgi:hypothetical protein